MANSTKTEKAFTTIKRKFLKVQMDKANVKFQLDTVSDLTIINKLMWIKISRLMLIA